MNQEIFTTSQYNLLNEIMDSNNIPHCVIYENSSQALAIEAALEHTDYSVYHNTTPVGLYVMYCGNRYPRWVGYVNITGKPCLILSKPMNWAKKFAIDFGEKEIEWDRRLTIDLTSEQSTDNGEGICFGNIANRLDRLTKKQVVADESIWYKGIV